MAKTPKRANQLSFPERYGGGKTHMHQLNCLADRYGEDEQKSMQAASFMALDNVVGTLTPTAAAAAAAAAAESFYLSFFICGGGGQFFCTHVPDPSPLPHAPPQPLSRLLRAQVSAGCRNGVRGGVTFSGRHFL